MPDKKWHARAYYAEGVRKRRYDEKTRRRVGPIMDVSGEFAIEVWATSRNALQMDLDVFANRTDIGRVEVWGPGESFTIPARPGSSEPTP